MTLKENDFDSVVIILSTKTWVFEKYEHVVFFLPLLLSSVTRLSRRYIVYVCLYDISLNVNGADEF